MKTFLKWLLITPPVLLFLAFAILNRQSVTVTLDPFGNDIPGLQFTAPLFIVIIVSGAVGALLGSAITWFGQGRHRRSLKEARSENERLRARLATLPVLPGHD